MDIYAKKGSFVKFANPTFGYEHDQKTAAQHLVVGQPYTVEKTEVGDYHTDVFLQEVPGVAFNSVLFEDVA